MQHCCLILSEQVVVPCYLLALEALSTVKHWTKLLCNVRQLLIFAWEADITYQEHGKGLLDIPYFFK